MRLQVYTCFVPPAAAGEEEKKIMDINNKGANPCKEGRGQGQVFPALSGQSSDASVVKKRRQSTAVTGCDSHTVGLQDATVTMAHGRRYGLVGRNGTGKTTLLRAMAQHQIKGIPDNCQILHVEQEVRHCHTTICNVHLAQTAS